MDISINDTSAMEALGGKIASRAEGGEVVYLSGELGAGKTTFVRGFLKILGHEGAVKSPTYTLVEPYSIAAFKVYHFDLYRVNDPNELEAMGIRDYCDGHAICLFEWPELGGDLVPKPDMVISISYADDGRLVKIDAKSEKAKITLKNL